MVKRCWNFFKFPLIKWKVILVQNNWKIKNPSFQRWGNEKTDIRFRGKPGFQASSSPLENTLYSTLTAH